MPLTNLLYKGIHFDSDEEVFVAMWLEELKEKEMVRCWTHPKEAHPLTPGLKILYKKITKLKTKTKTETKSHTILRASEYTPDFEVLWTIEGAYKLVTWIKDHLNSSPKLFFAKFWDKPTPIEVKPSFDQNNMEREFVLKQKYIWDKHQIFVNLVEPMSLFKKTFVPSLAAPYFKYKKSPTGKNKGKKGPGDWKMDWEPKTIDQFLNNK